MKPPSGHFDWEHVSSDEGDEIYVPDIKLQCKYCDQVVVIEDADAHLLEHPER